MQREMEEIQAALATRTVEGTSGGGAVKVTATCDGALKSVKIDPAAVSPDDVTMLEDLILTATNQALAEAKEINSSEMGKVTAGMGGMGGLGGLM